MKIVQISQLPPGFPTLADEAASEGHHFLHKMQEEWRTGKNRFDRLGEVLFSLESADGQLAGIGGLNIDPYADDPGIGRVRHVYLSPQFRGNGYGKALVTEVLNHAQGRFSRLRLRTHNPSAACFYQTLGFIVTPHEDKTHFYMEKIL